MTPSSNPVDPITSHVVTLTPLDRLVPVQPVDVREFPDWQSLREYMSTYAQITNQVLTSLLCWIKLSGLTLVACTQLYFVQSTVTVANHNAALVSASLELQVPDSLGEFSQVIACIHANGPQHSVQRWGNM